MEAPRIVAFVMAGGEGTRLRPLTDEIPKPALPFADRCRLIDFALSNLHNSGVRSTFVLLQYKPRAILEHLAANWPAASLDPGEFVEPVLPATSFQGTADAVRQSLDRLEGHDPDIVAVFAADHVYRMDVRAMAAFHQACDADATIATLPVPIEEASAFGLVCADRDARVRGFEEKPAVPTSAPGDASCVFVSMGIYLFRPAVLRAALCAAARRDEHDFGHHVLPRLVRDGGVFAYDFRRNHIPGLSAGEEPGYWRDVGTLAAYRAAERDVLGRQPRLRLDNPAWPIRCAGAAAAQALPVGSEPRTESIVPRPFRRDADLPQDLALRSA